MGEGAGFEWEVGGENGLAESIYLDHQGFCLFVEEKVGRRGDGGLYRWKTGIGRGEDGVK